MALKSVVCVGCKATKLVEYSADYGEIHAETGFDSFADVSDGLVFRWLCPACITALKAPLAEVFRLTGNNRYAHWSNLLTIAGLLPKEG